MPEPTPGRGKNEVSVSEVEREKKKSGKTCQLFCLYTSISTKIYFLVAFMQPMHLKRSV
jgi:hypothetical protein